MHSAGGSRERVTRTSLPMSADAKPGRHPAFALFVPVSSVANLIGSNPHASVRDAVLQIVARNSRTFAWRDGAKEREVTADDVDAVVARAETKDVRAVVRESGMSREDAVIRGLAAHLDDTVRAVRALTAVMPGFTSSTYDIAEVAKSMAADRTLSAARAAGIATGDAARADAGIEGVRAAVVDCAVRVRSRYAKMERLLGPHAPGADLTDGLRTAIASSHESTRDAAVESVAREFGTTLDDALRRGAAAGLRRAVSADRTVADRLPQSVAPAAETAGNRAFGTQSESRDVDAIAALVGHNVGHRNTAMKYARVYVTSNVAVDVGGRVDGVVMNAVGGAYVVESKRRVRAFLGVPEYERIQVELYMRMFGVRKCLHVEALNEERRETWIRRDNAILQGIAEGLCEAVREHVLPQCIPAVGARLVEDAFRRSRTLRAQGAPTFHTDAPSDELAGVWFENGHWQPIRTGRERYR